MTFYFYTYLLRKAELNPRERIFYSLLLTCSIWKKWGGAEMRSSIINERVSNNELNTIIDGKVLYPYISTSELASLMHISERAVQRMLLKFRGMGWIECEKGEYVSLKVSGSELRGYFKMDTCCADLSPLAQIVYWHQRHREELSLTRKKRNCELAKEYGTTRARISQVMAEIDAYVNPPIGETQDAMQSEETEIGVEIECRDFSFPRFQREQPLYQYP